MADNTRQVLQVNGPLVLAHLPGVPNGEQVRVGKLGLMGEVISLEGDNALIQVYESTEMLHPGESVVTLGHPFSVELGPGLLGGIFDGVQRPLTSIMEQSGDQIPRGLEVPALDREKAWHFIPADGLKAGAQVEPGMRLGSVQETETILHHILVPPDCAGELQELMTEGEYRVTDTIARVHQPLSLIHISEPTRLGMLSRMPSSA